MHCIWISGYDYLVWPYVKTQTNQSKQVRHSHWAGPLIHNANLWKLSFFCLQIKSHTNAMQVSRKIWKYKKVSVIEEAKPNQVIAQEMKSFEDYQEIR